MTGSAGALRPQVRADLEATAVGEAFFVFDRRSGRLHRLNGTAAAVLDALDGTTSVDELVTALTARFAAATGDVRSGTEALVRQLDEEGLLEGTTPPPGSAAPDVPGLAARHDPRTRRVHETLAAHDWTPASGPYRALGFAFDVQADDPALAGHLATVLASLAAPEADDPAPVRTYRIARPRGARPWRIWLDTIRVATAPSAPRTIDQLLWHVNRLAVLSSTEHTVLHAAGAVAPGGAVLMPAIPNGGKSTLVTGLVRAGLGYLSDEAVPLHADGRLRPFPKAISLDPGSWALFPELAPPPETAELSRSRWQIPPDRVRAGSVAGPAEPRWIVSPQYERGAVAHLEPLAPEDAFALLLEQSFHLGTADGALDGLGRLVEELPCHRLVAGDVDAAVAIVLDLVGFPGSWDPSR